MKKLFTMFALLLMAAVTTNVQAQETEPVAVDDGFYLVGNFNNWSPTDLVLAENTMAAGEYFIHNVKLAAGDEFKVIKVDGANEWVWYPANNVVVEEAGIYSIYFRPNGNSDWPLVNVWLEKTASPYVLTSESANGTVKFLVDGNETTTAWEGDNVVVDITPDVNYQITKVTVLFSVNDPGAAYVSPKTPVIEPEIELPATSDGYFFEMRAADAKVVVEYTLTLNLTALGEALEDANEFYDEIKNDEELANIAGTLQDAINTAQGIYDNPTDQNQIDQAVTDLNNALEAAQEAVAQLKMKPFIYTTAPGKYSTGFFTDKRTVLDGIEGVHLFVITAVDGNTLTATPVTVVPANTPFLVFNETCTEAFEIVATDKAADNVTACEEFQGTAEAMSFPDDVWSANDIYVCTGTNFYVVLNNGQIGAHKCWIQLPKAAVVPSGAPALDIVIGEGTTHINATLSDQVNDNVIYDLSGRRVANPTTGLYILNGKKVIMK